MTSDAGDQEERAWAAYLETRDPERLEEWRLLWDALNIEVPLGAWVCP